jgi:hypothetical protein
MPSTLITPSMTSHKLLYNALGLAWTCELLLIYNRNPGSQLVREPIKRFQSRRLQKKLIRRCRNPRTEQPAMAPSGRRLSSLRSRRHGLVPRSPPRRARCWVAVYSSMNSWLRCIILWCWTWEVWTLASFARTSCSLLVSRWTWVCCSRLDLMKQEKVECGWNLSRAVEYWNVHERFMLASSCFSFPPLSISLF